MDVNGREIRELIGLVAQLLKPGGLWINTGPLLYASNLTLAQKYTHEEILTLLEMAGFSVEFQQAETVTYLKSPLSTQVRGEQVWTFAARAPAQGYINTQVEFPPAWLQLPHLPIPQSVAQVQQQNPVLQQLLGLVDGRTSLQQIAAQMAPNLDPGQDALALVKTVFAQLLLGVEMEE